MSDYDAWLERPYQEAADRDAAIEAMVQQVLTEPDFDPTLASNFLLAVENGALEKVQDRIAKALQEEVVGPALGAVVYLAVYDYFYDLADKEAAHRYNSGFRDGGDF